MRILLVAAVLAAATGAMRGMPSAPAPEEGAVCAPAGDQAVHITWIGQEAARDLFGRPGVMFVDARARAEFVNGHIAGAVNVPMDTGAIPDDVIDLLRASQKVITYCDMSADCAASTALAGLLNTSGLPDVDVLVGGMPAWLDNDYPAEAGECRLCP